MAIFNSYVKLPEGMCLVWVKQCHRPRMTNGKYTTKQKMVMTLGGWCVYGIVLPTLLLFICHE